MINLRRLLKFDAYKRSILIAYGFVAAVFFVFPVTCVALVFQEITVAIYIQLIFGFVAPLMISGYLLSPIFGPLAKSKLMCFFMSFLSLILAVVGFLLVQLLNGESLSWLDIKVILYWFVIMVCFGVVPAFLSGLLFSGSCEKDLEK